MTFREAGLPHGRDGVQRDTAPALHVPELHRGRHRD